MERSSSSAAGVPVRWYAHGKRGACTIADAHGLTLRRNLRQITVPWPEIAAISQERRSGYLAGWITVVRLTDGSTLTDLPGISTADGTFSEQTDTAIATLTDLWQRALLAPPPAPAAPPTEAPAPAPETTPAVAPAPATPPPIQRPTTAARTRPKPARTRPVPARTRPASARTRPPTPPGHRHVQPSPRPTPRSRWLRAIFTAMVVGLLGASVFGLYNTIERMSLDHPAVAGYESARSCTADEVDWMSSSVWCRLSNLHLSADTDSQSPLLFLATDAPDVNLLDEISFYADYGQLSSVPPGLEVTSELTVIVHGGTDYVAAVASDGHTYPTTSSPLVQYATDTESMITAMACTAFLLVWTVRRLIRGHGPIQLRWFLLDLQIGLLIGAFVTLMFVASQENTGAVGTSITADVALAVALTSAAGAVTGYVTRRRLHGGQGL